MRGSEDKGSSERWRNEPTYPFMSHSDKTAVSVICTIGMTLVACGILLQALAVSPPRIGLQTAILFPFSHIAAHCGLSGWLIMLLAVAQFVLYGVVLGKGWVRNQLPKAIAWIVSLHLMAVGGALAASKLLD
jgi:hypothetical protein